MVRLSAAGQAVGESSCVAEESCDPDLMQDVSLLMRTMVEAQEELPVTEAPMAMAQQSAEELLMEPGWVTHLCGSGLYHQWPRCHRRRRGSAVPAPTPQPLPPPTLQPAPNPAPISKPIRHLDPMLPASQSSLAPTPWPIAIPTPQPTPIRTFRRKVAPNPPPTLVPTPQPSPMPTPNPTPGPTPTPTPIPTPIPTPVPTPKPTPIPTPRPTPLPTPQPTPLP
eukprot:CAMPEP_0204595892 /NCGR_PEP_ID=MMETSP0661-20131031/52930_1 /ASSEMBLY_ACC=CAM_ASM_000606 /TAXON_ID=109239 /ORGANISM="Alexandrium margalefi, Strain AMGDE01CS-322" /LENGTH=222 /DNA_ID=CAMNT_0051606455 /DNA_START=122 /DNA_END=787 /DNA_ORIENTATION=+